MRKKIPKRILSILLLFTMILTSVPAYALEGNGSGVGDNVPGSTNGTYNWSFYPNSTSLVAAMFFAPSRF